MSRKFSANLDHLGGRRVDVLHADQAGYVTVVALPLKVAHGNDGSDLNRSELIELGSSDRSVIGELRRGLHCAGSHDLLESYPRAETQLLLDGLCDQVILKLKLLDFLRSRFSFRNFRLLLWNGFRSVGTGWNVFSFAGTGLGRRPVNLRQNTGVWIVNLRDELFGYFSLPPIRSMDCSHVLVEVR